MRVRFLIAYRDNVPGDVIELDCALVEGLAQDGTIERLPRTEAEIQEAAARPQPGDEHRTPGDIEQRRRDLEALLRGNNQC